MSEVDHELQERTPGSGTAHRWVWALLSLVLVSLPFLAVDFVPSTDLPQHLGQLRLFVTAWTDPGGALDIQWWTPYGLVYGLLAIPWALLPPVAAGKVGVWLLVLLQAAAVHLVAAKYRRPVAGAVLAGAFLFHNQLYWGFLNFISGWLVFLGWFVLTRRSVEEESDGPRTVGLFLLVATLLYLAHALWFAAGVLWFGVEALISRRRPRDLIWRVAGLVPVVVVAAVWFMFLRGSDFATPPSWIALPHLRLHPDHFVIASLGGLKHIIEPILVVGVLGWALAAIMARRGRRVFGCDPYFAALALLFFGLYMVLPDKFSNTIRFSTRWLPFAFIALLLAIEAPPLRRPLRRALALALLLTHMVVTTAYWRRFETTELAGLEGTLAALPEEPRVIGLNYAEKSPLIRGQPFIQTFAWAQVVRGGELSFSFGYFAPSLVVYEDPGRVQWTWGLEWFPKTVRRSDFRYFDYAIVSGDEATHERMGGLPELAPVTREGVWRLYSVEGAEAPPDG